MVFALQRIDPEVAVTIALKSKMFVNLLVCDIPIANTVWAPLIIGFLIKILWLLLSAVMI